MLRCAPQGGATFFWDAGGCGVLPWPWEAAKSYVKEQWWRWLWFPSSDSQQKIAFLPKIHERLQFCLHHSQKILVHGCSWVHAFDVIVPMLSMQLRNFFRTPQQSPLAGKFAAATGEERPGAFHLWPSAPWEARRETQAAAEWAIDIKRGEVGGWCLLFMYTVYTYMYTYILYGI